MVLQFVTCYQEEKLSYVIITKNKTKFSRVRVFLLSSFVVSLQSPEGTGHLIQIGRWLLGASRI